jgi:hypothetical protein
MSNEKRCRGSRGPGFRHRDEYLRGSCGDAAVAHHGAVDARP